MDRFQPLMVTILVFVSNNVETSVSTTYSTLSESSKMLHLPKFSFFSNIFKTCHLLKSSWKVLVYLWGKKLLMDLILAFYYLL